MPKSLIISLPRIRGLFFMTHYLSKCQNLTRSYSSWTWKKLCCLIHLWLPFWKFWFRSKRHFIMRSLYFLFAYDAWGLSFLGCFLNLLIAIKLSVCQYVYSSCLSMNYLWSSLDSYFSKNINPGKKTKNAAFYIFEAIVTRGYWCLSDQEYKRTDS